MKKIILALLALSTSVFAVTYQQPITNPLVTGSADFSGLTNPLEVLQWLEGIPATGGTGNAMVLTGTTHMTSGVVTLGSGTLTLVSGTLYLNGTAVGYNSLTSGSSVLSGSSSLSGSAALSGSASQAGTALVSSSSTVSGSAAISGSAAQAGTALTSSSSTVSGSAAISGSAAQAGTALTSSSSTVSGSAAQAGTALTSSSVGSGSNIIYYQGSPYGWVANSPFGFSSLNGVTAGNGLGYGFTGNGAGLSGTASNLSVAGVNVTGTVGTAGYATTSGSSVKAHQLDSAVLSSGILTLIGSGGMTISFTTGVTWPLISPTGNISIGWRTGNTAWINDGDGSAYFAGGLQGAEEDLLIDFSEGANYVAMLSFDTNYNAHFSGAIYSDAIYAYGGGGQPLVKNGYLYDGDETYIADAGGRRYYGNGSVLGDADGNLYYGNDNSWQLANASGNLFFANNIPLTDASGNIYNNSADIVVDMYGMIYLQPYMVSTLPNPPTQGGGATCFVTDALSPVYLAPVVGGGTTFCPVFYNGTTWVCH